MISLLVLTAILLTFSTVPEPAQGAVTSSSVASQPLPDDLDDLASASNYPLWISLCWNVIFMAVSTFLTFYYFFAARRSGGAGEGTSKISWVPVYHAYGALNIFFLLAVMDGALLLPQGSTVRSDGVEVIWLRWAVMSVVFAISSWMVCNYLTVLTDARTGTMTGGEGLLSITTTFSGMAGGVSLLIATICSSPGLWFWFGMACLMWFITTILYIVNYALGDKGGREKKSMNALKATMVISFSAVVYATYVCVWAFGDSAANLAGFSFTAERILYFVGEVLITAYVLVVILTEAKAMGLPGFARISAKINSHVAGNGKKGGHHAF